MPAHIVEGSNLVVCTPHDQQIIAVNRGANELPGSRFRVGHAALTMAEYFRDDERRDVLLLIDNIFRFIQAGSEISGLMGQMPSRLGYQPTLGTELSQLEERIANTDADSVVPVHWLATHWAAAERGAGLLLGTVRPDPGELDDEVADRWYRRHQLTDGHLHVHGANLGVRADWYLAVGGFADVAGDEDVALAAAVSAAGGVVERTGAGPVVTSARLDGRAPAGLAGYLRQLSATPDTVVEGFPA